MNEKTKKVCIIIFVTILIVVLFDLSCPIIVRKIKNIGFLIPCQKNMRYLGIALHQYAADNNGLYPTPSKWCDLLVEKGIDKDKFWCRSVGYTITDSPIEETNDPVQVRFVFDDNDEQGKKKYAYQIEGANYGLNPNAEPNSAPNEVLLFETSNGWNKFGGPESVSITNHLEIYGKEGCNILFNDGRISFINPKDLPKLNWGKAHLRK